MDSYLTCFSLRRKEDRFVSSHCHSHTVPESALPASRGKQKQLETPGQRMLCRRTDVDLTQEHVC